MLNWLTTMMHYILLQILKWHSHPWIWHIWQNKKWRRKRRLRSQPKERQTNLSCYVAEGDRLPFLSFPLQQTRQCCSEMCWPQAILADPRDSHGEAVAPGSLWRNLGRSHGEGTVNNLCSLSARSVSYITLDPCWWWGSDPL